MRSSVFANVKDIDMYTGGGPPIPRSVYEMVVESAESKDTANGDPALSLWVAVVADHAGDSEHEGHTVPLWLMLDGFKSDKAAQFAKAKLMALGVNLSVDQDDQQIADSLLGRRFFAKLDLEDASHKDESGQIVPTYEDMPGGGQRRAKRNVIGSMWNHNPKADRDEAPTQQGHAGATPQAPAQGYAPAQAQQPFFQPPGAPQGFTPPAYAPQSGPPPPYPQPPPPPVPAYAAPNNAQQVPQQARRGRK